LHELDNFICSDSGIRAFDRQSPVFFGEIDSFKQSAKVKTICSKEYAMWYAPLKVYRLFGKKLDRKLK